MLSSENAVHLQKISNLNTVQINSLSRFWTVFDAWPSLSGEGVKFKRQAQVKSNQIFCIK